MSTYLYFIRLGGESLLFSERSGKMKRAALLGMPNCGKSTLYQLLTGKRVPTGNRAGVTVDASSAPLLGSGGDIRLIDLPGIRSADPSSEDEAVTYRYLTSDPPDLLITVVDATDFERQIRPLGALAKLSGSARVLVAFNFCDELEHFPESKALSETLGCPALAVSARTGQGISELIAEIRRSLFTEPREHEALQGCLLCNGCGKGIDRIAQLLGDVSGRKRKHSERLDQILLRPVFGLPIFFAVMTLILWLTFGAPGEALTSGFCDLILDPLFELAERQCANAPEWLSSLICNGVLGGVGAVLSFLPRLLILFLFQSFLEQSGFLARTARLFDPWLIPLGLRGDAVTPMLLGFGCSVPAVLCTRSMKDCVVRERCASFLPVVACSARMPLCMLISDCFFGGAGWVMCALIWLFSGVCFLLFCALEAKWKAGKHLPQRHDDPLPRWRFPDGRELFSAVWSQALHFVTRAGELIFLCSVLIWLLSDFRWGSPMPVDPEDSILATFGRWLAPVFAPAGFGDWRIVAALLAGIGAKEASLSTLGVLLGGGQNLSAALASSEILTPASALSFLIFYTLYFPCAATLSTMRKREKRYLWFPLLFAYILSVLVYQVVTLFV